MIKNKTRMWEVKPFVVNIIAIIYSIYFQLFTFYHYDFA